MCGVCGVAGGPAAGASDWTARAAAALAHRGPGDRSVVVRRLRSGGGPPAESVALGLARLHVVEPDAPSGPYETADGLVAAAVNGEIWNHAELRRDLRDAGHAVADAPDTAVVAPLWAGYGVAGLARLRGMFAAAIHDARDGSLVLARDRFGIKPLHHTTGAPVRFASEAEVLGHGGGVTPGALADYLTLGVVPAPETFDAGVRQVPPGTALVFRDGRVTARVFAPIPVPGTRGAPSPAELRVMVTRAVRRHLAGDLPCAVLLSGGVDSSIVAALAAGAAREAGRPAPALVTLGFPGEGGYDESAAAAATARHLGLPLHAATLVPGDVEEILGCVVRAHGGPFADASALATFALCRAARRVSGAVLSGTGADELFAGYRRYRLGRIPVALRLAAGAAASVLPSSRRTRLGTLGALARKASRAAGGDDASAYLETIAVVPASVRARLLGSAEPPPVLARVADVFRRARAAGRGTADAGREADLGLYLPDDVLAKEDRAAAAVSLENRVPFLDDEVADAAGAAPASAHLAADGVRGAKASLRATFARSLPPATLDRPKRGFAVPVSEWLRGPLRAFAAARLDDPTALWRGHLDPAAASELVARHRAGDDDSGPAVWALVVLEEALRRRHRA